MEKLTQGADVSINITLVGTDGNPIEISNCENVKLFIYQTREYVLAEYDLNEGEIEIIDSVNGVLRVNVLGSSVNFISGRVFAEAVVNVIDTDFDAGYQVYKITDMALFDVVNSVS